MTGIFYYRSYNDEPIPEKIHKIKKRVAHRGKDIEKEISNEKELLKIYVNKAQYKNQICEIWDKKLQDSVKIIIDGWIINDHDKNTGKLTTKDIYEDYNVRGFSAFKNYGGYYSIVIIQAEKVSIIKDPVGHNPLYYIKTPKYLLISSELKSFNECKEAPRILEPGTAITFTKEGYNRYEYHPTSTFLPGKSKHVQSLAKIKNILFHKLNNAVLNSIKNSGKVGSLLSGGIDSSIITALASEKVPNLNTYTVAVEGSQDLKHAKLFAEEYRNKINHHYFYIELDDMLKILSDVIYHLETFDAALIRSAIPMYYISSKIGNDIDILLTGEGADELFGGYAYLKEFEGDAINNELLELLEIEHATGLQRVDRIPYGFGLEARAPWFDIDIVRYAFKIPNRYKVKPDGKKLIEKWIIRETFQKIIPKEIAWREKAKFSKGVGSQFILKEYAENQICDKEFDSEKEIYNNIFVKSKEELLYWRIFHELFNPKEEFVSNLPRTAQFII